MIVDLTDKATGPIDFDVAFEPPQMDLEMANMRLIGPVRAKGTIEKRHAWFDLRGLIEGNAEIDCSRCLEPIDRKLSIAVEIRLADAETTPGPQEREVASSDLDLSEIEGERIDLTEVIREQILLDLPEQVFCREGCKGLCPQCGANRNLIDCKCEDGEVDPRWAALKNLK